MNRFILGWIVFQLLVIGLISGSTSYDMLHNQYKCNIDPEMEIVPFRTLSISKFETLFVSVVFPLTYFIPENIYEINYCNDYFHNN